MTKFTEAAKAKLSENRFTVMGNRATKTGCDGLVEEWTAFDPNHIYHVRAGRLVSFVKINWARHFTPEQLREFELCE